MYKRHTLVSISQVARERIFAELIQQGLDVELCGSLLLPEKFTPDVQRYPWCNQYTPALGIVRREEVYKKQGYIPVGFSSWKRQHGGQRFRIASFIKQEEIVAIASPYDVLAILQANPIKYQRTNANMALLKLLELATEWHMKLGVWGSVAQELMTGYFYTHEESDLDVILSIPELNENTVSILYRWFNEVMRIEQCLAIRIDTELELANGYGIALKEFFSEGRSILGKGLEDVQLFSKKEIFADWSRFINITEAIE